MMRRTPLLSTTVALVTLLLSEARPASAQSLEPPPPLGAPPAAPPPTGAPPPSAPPAALPSMVIMPPTPAASDESQDSGLGLEWVWFNAEVGAAYVNLQSFDASNLALQKTETGGPAFGVAAGVRLLFLTLGVRARDLQLASIGNLWELSFEAALHTRVGHIDPYLGVRGGYNFVGSLNGDSVQAAAGTPPPDVSIHGFDIGPTVGVDFYLMKLISLGFDVDAQLLFLQRPKPALPAGITESSLPPQYQQLYDNSGSSVGIGVTGAAHLGIHF